MIHDQFGSWLRFLSHLCDPFSGKTFILVMTVYVQSNQVSKLLHLVRTACVALRQCGSLRGCVSFDFGLDYTRPRLLGEDLYPTEVSTACPSSTRLTTCGTSGARRVARVPIVQRHTGAPKSSKPHFLRPITIATMVLTPRSVSAAVFFYPFPTQYPT